MTRRDYAEDLLAAEFELRQAHDAGAMRRWLAMEEAAGRGAARATAVAEWAADQSGKPAPSEPEDPITVPLERRPRLDLWLAFLFGAFIGAAAILLVQ